MTRPMIPAMRTTRSHSTPLIPRFSASRYTQTPRRMESTRTRTAIAQKSERKSAMPSGTVGRRFKEHDGPWPPGTETRLPPQLHAERLRGALRRHGDDDARQSLGVLPEERLNAAGICLPALPQPRPDRALHPGLLVTQEASEQPERAVQVARSDEAPHRVGRGPASPEVFRARPPQDIVIAAREQGHHGADRAHGQPVAQGPAGRLLDPGVREAPGLLVETAVMAAREQGHHGADRAHGQPVAQGPAGRLLDPGVREAPGLLVET